MASASFAVMYMIQDIPSEAAAEEKVRSLLANKQVIVSFGHRIYKNGNPRNAIFKSLSSELAQGGGKGKLLFDMSVHIEALMAKEKNM